MPLRSPGRRPIGRPRCFIPWCPPLCDLSSSDAACVSPGRAASPAADAQDEPSRTSTQRNQGLMGSGNSHPTFLRGGGVWQDRPGKLPSAVPARIRPVSVRGQPTTGVAVRSSGPVWGRVPAPCRSPALRGSPPATLHTGAKTPPAHPPDISFPPTDNTQHPRLWGGGHARQRCVGGCVCDRQKPRGNGGEHLGPAPTGNTANCSERQASTSLAVSGVLQRAPAIASCRSATCKAWNGTERARRGRRALAVHPACRGMTPQHIR